LKQTIRPNINSLAEGILQGNRIVLSQAITLIESKLEDDQKLSAELLEKIIHATGNSIRIGITGVPGVGKSTFIEKFGMHVTGQGKNIAVLTVDPSSQLSKGSILGDKTRMEELSKNPKAFVRPSPSGSILGGVAYKTHDVIALCEAAGFEVMLIETVGVGQSEVAVKNITDFFLLLMLAGAGDDLQGIKKGVTEMADAIVITKADGDNIKRANAAMSFYQQGLHLLPPSASGWNPKVLTSSAMTGKGIAEIWNMILAYKTQATASGFFLRNRSLQNKTRFKYQFEQVLFSDYMKFETLKENFFSLEQHVGEGNISAASAAEKLLQAYHRAIQEERSRS
jgi:LAO/AO transport system kinase